LWIAIKDLLLVVRDKKAILTLVIMPLLLISILGAAFGDVMKEGGDIKIDKFTLGIVNLDSGPMGSVLTKEVFTKGLSDQVHVKEYQKKELYQKVKNKNLSVGLIIPADFTSALMSGKEAKVKLITVPDPGVKAIVVQNVIEQFSQSFKTESVMAALRQPGQMNQQGAASSQGFGLTENKASAGHSTIKETTVNAKTKPVGSFQYYAAAMGVMFLLMTVVQGVSNMIQEKEQEVYKRLLISNLTYSHYLAGKMLGLFVVCTAQFFIIIFGTRLLYGVRWGNSLAGVSLITIAYVISACGLGVLAGTLLKTEKSFNVAGMIGTQLFAAVGGSMVPLYIFPDGVITLTKLLPNGLALQSYLKLMSGSSFTEILGSAAGLLGLGLLFFTIGLIRLSLERRGKYA
jgi:ABC-2 type transport system permease protein